MAAGHGGTRGDPEVVKRPHLDRRHLAGAYLTWVPDQPVIHISYIYSTDCIT